MKMFGLIKAEWGNDTCWKGFFLLENGQNWMYGYIQSGKKNSHKS